MEDAATANTQDGQTGSEAQGEQTGTQEQSVDQLLEEFGKKTPEPGTDTEPKTPPTGQPAVIDAATRQQIVDEAVAQVEARNKATDDFGSVAGEIGKKAGISKPQAEKLLAGYLVTDARAMEVWQKRNHSVEQGNAWKKVQDGLARELSEDISKATSGTSDRASARASARTQSGTPSAEGDFGGKTPAEIEAMPHGEFEAYKKTLFR